MEAVEEIAPFKGPGVECHIDSPGEPTLYPDIVALVEWLKQIKEVAVVSMQSNGTLLDPNLIKSLEEAGLDRINLSIHALEPTKAAYLAGVPWFDIEKVKEVYTDNPNLDSILKQYAGYSHSDLISSLIHFIDKEL